MIRTREDRWFERFRRTGQPRLLAKVFDRTAPELWRVAAHLCRDRHAAEDAVQGTFLTAIEQRHDWDAARPLLPWLLGMLANRVRDHRRRATRVPDAERVNVSASEARDPAELAEGHEFGAAFREALSRIDEPYRSALEQNLVHGLAAHEIARELGVPPGTVRMRLYRGLEQLRQRLPKGFVAGSAVATVMAPEAFAGMRQVVLDGVGGVPGSATAVVGGAGHVAVGVGAVLMKKVILAAAALALVALGTWNLWGSPGAAAGSSLPTASVAEANTRRLDPIGPVATQGPVPDTAERSAVSPAPAALPRGQLRLALRHGGNRKPVAGIEVQVLAGMAEDPRTRTSGGAPTAVTVAAEDGAVQSGVTDAAGVASFDLPPGFAQLTLTTLPQREQLVAEVVADRLTELAIDLPVALEADVLVTDRDGRPVAGAMLLGQPNVYFGPRGEIELGRTGVGGRWREAFVEPNLMVRAVAPGHAASLAELLDKNTQTATLCLGDRPAILAGTVLGEDGRPVANAQLAIKPQSNTTVLPLFVRADEQGRYECAWVPPGPCTVFAWFAIAERQNRFARADVVAVVDERTVADLRFTRGARILARLQRPDGQPLIHACVMASPEMRIGMGVDVGRQGRTDERGQCTIDGLLPGTWDIRVHVENDSLREQVQLAEGQDYEIGGRLGGTAWIEVEAVDEAREPLVGWTVQLLAPDDMHNWTVRQARTDERGIVRFERLPERSVRVSLQGAVQMLPSMTREVPPNVRTQLVVARAQMPLATVRGTFVLPEDVAIDEVQCTLIRAPNPKDAPPDANDRVRGTIDPTGRFVFDNLPAGSYLLGVLRTGARPRGVLCMRGGIEVTVGSELDLGTIALGMSTLRFAVTRSDGRPARGLDARLATVGTGLFGSLPQTNERGVVELTSVPAGQYEALVWGEDLAPIVIPVTAALGRTTEVPIVAEAAILTTFRFVDVPTGVRVAMLRVLRAGVVIAPWSLTELTAPCIRGLPPGDYRVEVESVHASEAVRGAADFSVGAAPGEPIELRLAR